MSRKHLVKNWRDEQMNYKTTLLKLTSLENQQRIICKQSNWKNLLDRDSPIVAAVLCTEISSKRWQDD